MKHKHAEFIKLKADGVRIETDVNGEWIGAYWGDFNDNNLTFRISPNQPADEEGWIQWFGGENPAVGKRVEYKLRDSQQSSEGLGSEALRWWHRNHDSDIVAYRIHKEKAFSLWMR